MALTRRRFLRSAAAGAALAGCAPGALLGRRGGPQGAVFRHGVASGDPLHDRVVLWTRATPRPGRAGEPLPVDWRIATDEGLHDVVGGGRVRTGPGQDHTVHVDAGGLEAGRVYYYGFECGGEASAVGRTRTLPGGSPERVRFACCCCANLPQGLFTAYRHIAARRDLDAVLHLGDYLYEYANGGFGDGTELGRVPRPDRVLASLADYRGRHAQYKTDPDLQELHRSHPVIAVWDDHELANNAWLGGAENHDPARDGPWPLRRAAAVRAYYEWMPVRPLPVDASWSSRGHLFRSFRFGDLAHLAMLDTRLYGRSEQAARGDLAALQDPAREMLGLRQRVWALEELARAQVEGVAWKLLGQQVMFAPLAPPGRDPHPDAWDGYPRRRGQILDWIEHGGIDDVVILTGDIHSSWALDVPRTPWKPGAYAASDGRGSLAVELVAPALAAAPLGTFPRAVELYGDALQTHPHVRLAELDQHGYFVVDLDRERARAEWWWMDSVVRPDAPEHRGAAFRTERGRSHLVAD